LASGWSDRSEGEPASWGVADRFISANAAGILVPSFATGARSDMHNLVLWRWGPDLPHRVVVFDPDRKLPRDQRSWFLVEIKVAESWTLEELEDALAKELCEKYLRAREGRHGILLLVHQASRPRDWSDRAGKALNFDQVVSNLRYFRLIPPTRPSWNLLSWTYRASARRRQRRRSRRLPSTKKEALSSRQKISAFISAVEEAL
jgi:hypothetical protein